MWPERGRMRSSAFCEHCGCQTLRQTPWCPPTPGIPWSDSSPLSVGWTCDLLQTNGTWWHWHTWLCAHGFGRMCCLFCYGLFLFLALQKKVTWAQLQGQGPRQQPQWVWPQGFLMETQPSRHLHSRRETLSRGPKRSWAQTPDPPKLWHDNVGGFH